jgi:hypothetical protein
MDKIKVFNPGPSEKVADREGHIIAAHDWAEVDPADAVTQRLLQNGGLIVPEEPAKEPAKADPEPTESAPAEPAKTKRGSEKTAAKNGDS